MEQVKKAEFILAVPQFYVLACRHLLNLDSYDPAKCSVGKLSTKGPHKNVAILIIRKRILRITIKRSCIEQQEKQKQTFNVTRMQVSSTLVYNCCNFYIDGLMCCVAMVKLCCSFKVLK